MTSDREERELLVAAASSAHRGRDANGSIVVDSAWLDLDAAGRREAFELATTLRALEASLDPDGLSATGRAILAKINRK